MKLRHAPDKQPSQDRWLLTYADLITLLMIFFVLLYAISSIDSIKFKEVSSSLKGAMGEKKEDKKNSSQMLAFLTSTREYQLMNVVEKRVQNYISRNELGQNISIKMDNRGLVISMKDTLFFSTGKAEILPGVRSQLAAIGNMLAPLSTYIRVEGHTDNVPIKNSQFQSNWELSVIRATTVAQFLINEVGIKPTRLSAIGYGEFRPRADNKTPSGRSLNRRVDIILLSSKYNEVENNSKVTP